MKNILSTALKGMLIGVANIIPGVSGGTMAFILGIYHQLTEAIGYFLIRPEKRKEYFIFLCNLGIGVVVGLLLFAKLISFLLGVDLPADAPTPFTYVPTCGFFLGLIMGSFPVLSKMQTDTKCTSIRLVLLILGATLLIVIASLREPANIIYEQSQIIKDFGVFKITALPISRMIWLFFIGILSAFTMVVPGISGSALLVALGEYAPILNYISERLLVPLGIIGAGAGFGIILATLLMSKLLEHKPGATFYFILGLVGASCSQIISQMLSVEVPISSWIIAIPMTTIGMYIAFLSEKLQPKS